MLTNYLLALLFGATPQGVHVPRIYPALPAGPFIDLGPLRHQHRMGEAVEDEQKLMLMLADRLHADVIVIERRGLGQVYLTDKDREIWTRQHYADHTDLDVTYYRALRLGPDQPAKTPLDSGVVAGKLALRLAAETTLGHQLAILHQLYTLGELPLDRYEVIRAYLCE